MELESDREVIMKGEEIAQVVPDDAPNAQAVEEWVKLVAAESHARLEWGYFAGQAIVFHDGDNDSLCRAYLAIGFLVPKFRGTVIVNGVAYRHDGVADAAAEQEPKRS
jgi:hypothetical protein